MPLPDRPDALMLLHNPRCSKSRATLGLLEDRGVEVQVRLYLDDPLTQAELADLETRLGRSALEFARKGQAEFAGAGLDDSSTSEDVRQAMAAHPILIERPILIRGDRAAIGRPPEDVLALLDD